MSYESVLVELPQNIEKIPIVLLAHEILLPQASMSMRQGHDLLLHRESRCVRARCNLCGAHQICVGSDSPLGRFGRPLAW